MFPTTLVASDDEWRRCRENSELKRSVARRGRTVLTHRGGTLKAHRTRVIPNRTNVGRTPEVMGDLRESLKLELEEPCEIGVSKRAESPREVERPEVNFGVSFRRRADPRTRCKSGGRSLKAGNQGHTPDPFGNRCSSTGGVSPSCDAGWHGLEGCRTAAGCYTDTSFPRAGDVRGWLDVALVIPTRRTSASRRSSSP